MSNLPAPSVSWSDVARACRRACVLRERGKVREAEQVTRSLPDLIFAVRTADDTDAALAERLEALLSHEAERVANAAVLAELLAPMLSEKLDASGSSRVSSSSPASHPSSPPAASRPLPARPGSIADFIDEMIAQEGPPDRAGSPPRP